MGKLDFFIKSGINSFGLLAATPNNYPNMLRGTLVDHYIDPKRMTAFLIKIYNLWKETANPNIRIREIDGIIKQLTSKSGHCTLKGGCFGHYYLINPNGDIAHCDLYLGDPHYNFGNLYNTDFHSIRNSDKLRELKEDNDKEIKMMQQCKEFEVCNGWCPHERYLSVRHNPYYNANCCGLYDLITHIRNNLPEFIK